MNETLDQMMAISSASGCAALAPNSNFKLRHYRRRQTARLSLRCCKPS